LKALIFILGLYIQAEFKRHKLDIKYQKEIEEWLKYKREEYFGKKSEKQIQDEIERFMKENTAKNIDKIIEKKFGKKNWEIEYPK